MLPCLAIIATMCFHKASSVTFHDSGLGAKAEALVRGVQVDIVTRTDQILFLDWRKLPGACSGTFCVAYFKKCKAGEGRFTCEYRYSYLDDAVERVVRLTGNTAQQVKAAEGAISVISPLGSLTAEIPLASFTTESMLDAPPYCRAGGPLADCWPKTGH